MRHTISPRLLGASALSSAVGLAALGAGAGVSAASSWATAAHAGSSGEAQAQAALAAPAGVTATCSAPTTAADIAVNWGGVTHAATYTILMSHTSATSGFAPAATGVTGTSHTFTNLPANRYWYEVEALVGTHWVSVASGASAESTTANKNPFCTQP